ncbi:MAG: TetR/AcrR family transcriptional regulator [Eubacterium sp.]|nr:TetR/AcrR family transcriptional regulator [Eubacterium sp.]
MGIDARTRYTKMMIRESFIQLLKEQPVSKITVTKICEIAEINRATFYKYYEDAFDLLQKLEQELLEEILNSLSQFEQLSIRESFIQLLEHLKKRGEWFQIIGSSHGDPQFASRILSVCYENASFLIQKFFPHLTGTQKKWLYYFLAHGYGGLLGCWLDNGLQEPTEEIARFAEELLLKVTALPATSPETNA